MHPARTEKSPLAVTFEQLLSSFEPRARRLVRRGGSLAAIFRALCRPTRRAVFVRFLVGATFRGMVPSRVRPARAFTTVPRGRS